MIAEPKRIRCRVEILAVFRDPDAGKKWHVLFVLKDVPSAERQNAFFETGKELDGFSFDDGMATAAGREVMADVEFLGDPFHRHYQLDKISVL